MRLLRYFCAFYAWATMTVGLMILWLPCFMGGWEWPQGKVYRAQCWVDDWLEKAWSK